MRLNRSPEYALLTIIYIALRRRLWLVGYNYMYQMISFFLTVGLFSTSISMFQFCSWSIRMFITSWEKFNHTAYLCIYGLFDAHFATRGNPYTLRNNSCIYERYPRVAGQCGPCPEMIQGGSVVLVILSGTWHMHYYGPPLHQIHILKDGDPEGVFLDWQLILLSVIGAVEEPLASCLHGGPLYVSKLQLVCEFDKVKRNFYLLFAFIRVFIHHIGFL